jgi:hypothetical protein
MVNLLPEFVIQAVAAELADELRNSRLEVCKIRSFDGWIRIPITSNPAWYSRLCANWERRRRRYPKPRTIIKRQQTIRSLDRISHGMKCGRTYWERLLPIIAEEAEARGY